MDVVSQLFSCFGIDSHSIAYKIKVISCMVFAIDLPTIFVLIKQHMIYGIREFENTYVTR